MKYKHTHTGGCKTYFLRTEETFKNNLVKVHYCPKHHVEVCRCGVEWGKHQEYYELLKQEQ